LQYIVWPLSWNLLLLPSFKYDIFMLVWQNYDKAYFAKLSLKKQLNEENNPFSLWYFKKSYIFFQLFRNTLHMRKNTWIYYKNVICLLHSYCFFNFTFNNNVIIAMKLMFLQNLSWLLLCKYTLHLYWHRYQTIYHLIVCNCSYSSIFSAVYLCIFMLNLINYNEWNPYFHRKLTLITLNVLRISH